MTGMRIASLAVTPVKGLALSHPDAVDITSTGVRGDRRYALVDAAGRIVNGKRLGPLVRMRTTWSDDPEALVLHLPDGTTVGGAVELGDRIDPALSGSTRPARLVLGPASAALSDAIGEPLRLVRLPDGEGVDRVGVGAITLQSTASLDALAQVLGTAEPVDGRRFRMTVTVSGAGPHDEDAWLGRAVRLGTAVIVPEGHVGRCAVTTQDPDTGERDLDTLHAIARYRDALPTTEPLAFGIHARVLVPGRVAVGDAVAVGDVHDARRGSSSESPTRVGSASSLMP